MTPFALALTLVAQAAAANAPSHPPFKDCAWERFSDAGVGLEAWVLRCDYGFRKIDFFGEGRALKMRYSDGGKPEAVIEVLDLLPGEGIEAGIRRLFDARTGKDVAKRCVIHRISGAPKGAERYTFVPDAAYAKELKARQSPDEVPDPACGDWGDSPDGIQYFEAQPGRSTGSVLFVRVGQDDPLFDEKTLRLLPAKPR
jgi:hypothetical protein